MSISLVNRFDTGVSLRSRLPDRNNQETVAFVLQPSSKPGARATGRASAALGREARREALLDEAAQEFNARGISGASVARIARRVGLTRAAVYYYFEDRHDLTVQCYARACEIMARDLAAAEAASGPGLERVLGFLRLALDPKRAPVAALSELDYLRGSAHAAIALAQRRNVERLRALVRSGVEDGTIRACDDEIVAQTLIGTVTWIPLSVEWVQGTDETYRARTAEALCDLVADGQAADRSFAFIPAVAIESFFPVPAAAFDRVGVSAAKVEQLLMTASQLFNRRGIDGTSLDDITEVLGATKGVLYHYLASKTDLVVRCYRRGFALYERFADAAERCGRTGLERGLIGLYLNVQAHASGLSPLIQMAGASALPAADGSFRRIDFDAVAQLGAGAFQWLPKWFRTDDVRAAEKLGEEIVVLFIRGLRAG
jgi:AcrR family transcriptional regulator